MLQSATLKQTAASTGLLARHGLSSSFVVVDIHAHILPGLDDGPKTLDDAVAMIKLAAEDGTTDIVATPHANFEFQFDSTMVAARMREVEDRSSGLIRIHRGCELHLSAPNILDALEHPTKYTINGTKYLLLEVPMFAMPTSVENVLSALRERGITPIIAHPERNAFVRRDVLRLRSWVERGVRIQITAQSTLRRFGGPAQRSSDDLLERGLVHMIASDSHDVQYRPPVLASARAVVAARYGEPAAKRLFVDNPSAVIAGRSI